MYKSTGRRVPVGAVRLPGSGPWTATAGSFVSRHPWPSPPLLIKEVESRMNAQGSKTKDRLVRLLQMSRFLCTHPGSSTSQIAQRFEISIRTVYRDVALLREAGTKLFCERCLEAISPTDTVMSALQHEPMSCRVVKEKRHSAQTIPLPKPSDLAFGEGKKRETFVRGTGSD